MTHTVSTSSVIYKLGCRTPKSVPITIFVMISDKSVPKEFQTDLSLVSHREKFCVSCNTVVANL